MHSTIEVWEIPIQKAGELQKSQLLERNRNRKTNRKNQRSKSLQLTANLLTGFCQYCASKETVKRKIYFLSKKDYVLDSKLWSPSIFLQ